jgi:uncharacterized protein (TIRG00374 family)
MRKLSFWLGLVIGSLALYLAWRGLEWSQVIQVLSRAHWFNIALALTAILLAFALMAWRWQLVVAQPEVSYRKAWTSLFVALMVNNLLPGRVGELARPILMARQTGLAQGYLLAKAFIDRIFDLAVLGAWGGWMLLFIPTMPWARQVTVSGIIICALVLIGVLVLKAPFLQHKLMQLQMPWLPVALRTKIFRLREDFHIGLQNVQPSWWALTALTFFIWGLVGASLYLTLQALSVYLDFWSLVLLGVSLNLGALIPALPGQVGTYQLIAVWVLGSFGIEKEAALGFALMHHALWYVPSVLLGFISLGYSSMSLKQLLRSQGSDLEGTSREWKS